MAKLKFGKAFSDEVKKISSKSHLKLGNFDPLSWQESLIAPFSSSSSSPNLKLWRKLFLILICFITFIVLVARLFHLQVIEGKHNQELADSNRIQVKVIHAPRGVIYDRNGKILAQNEPGFRLIEKHGQEASSSYISRDEALQMEVRDDPRLKLLEVDSKRAYPFKEKMAHILGYVGEITAEELNESKYKDYQLGDKIGRSGVEETYEKFLRGIDGGEVIEVDSTGKKLRTLRKKDAIPGQNLYLSVDADLQTVAYLTLEQGVKKVGSCCGAVVAQDPKTGQILALASYPSFNPQDLSDALVNSSSPLLNRVIGGTYPPGSTFKIASSLAGLSSGKITAQTQFEDTGVMNLGTFSFANWYFTEYGRKEGQVDIVKAIKRSNDIYFYNVGQLVGEKTLADVAKKLGLGETLGIDLPGEVSGLIPDNIWKVKTFNQIWYPGDTLHMAIGQGYVLTTPLQINYLVSTIASDGKQFPPTLAYKITEPSGQVIKEFKYTPINSFKFSEHDLSLVRQGLAQVPKDGGTGWPFFTFPIQTAGKTGTAEFGDPKNKTHAWYTSYAPADNPQISMTALVEAGGEGSNTAAPIVKEIYRYYFSPDKKNLIKDLGPIATESAKTLGE